ncbi:helix-turn-helix domain-containing protein [Paenibacillus contaminans]|uniref:HTH cro/C1-type domain-containing protein n=1 Tax=Paenibacillus contaminans TaxID=450362 RepID=A0A329MGN8_9BACL|nr:LexA family transcriptional regulator [Paenibacillus contaminans]RAV18852.1 hypothetical protein DQG23_24295 [Paenibacillus contaminans]
MSEANESRIRKLRKERKLSGIKVAQMMNITPQYYYDIEKGERRLTAEIASDLADILNTTVDYLIGKTDINLYDWIQSPAEEAAEALKVQEEESQYSIVEPNKIVDMRNKSKARLDAIMGKLPQKNDSYNSEPISVELVPIPIYGEIRAGYDSLANEMIIGYEYMSKDAVKDGEYFYLIVKGDSMVEEGIREGMRVLVKKQSHVENGKIGVVLVNGDEGTLKRVFYDGNNVILQASNRSIGPKSLPIKEVRIQGQVKKVEFDV